MTIKRLDHVSATHLRPLTRLVLQRTIFPVSIPTRAHVAISEPRLRQRLLAMGGVALLHVLVYLAVTRATLLRPTSAFTDFRVGLDDKIPHLPWTWPAYWLPYVLVPIAAGVSTTRLGTRPFWRLILAWSGMIAIGGVIHLVWPTVAPWPMSPAATQRWYHNSALILPYATLPSMHVGHVTLAALVAGTVFPALPVRATAFFLVIAAAVATLTLKEHLVLDALSGIALAAAVWVWWRRGARCIA